MRLPSPHRLRLPRRCTAIGTACAAVLVMAGVAACGSAGRQAGASAGGGAGAGSGEAAAACAPSSLRVTVDAAAAGSAAGSTFYPIDFTNGSGVSCRLDGYPDAWFATSAGHRIGSPASRDRAVTARPVALMPGATAHAWLQVTAAANYPAKACRPVTAHWLRIRVPGAAAVRAVRHAFPACAAAMHGHGILTVQPVAPGRGRRGAA
jgi:Protein of unknown function (DUF4232)